METGARKFEKVAGPSHDDRASPIVDLTMEMRLMAREFGWDEAKLIQIRDIPSPWLTRTGQPVGSTPVVPHSDPAWLPRR